MALGDDTGRHAADHRWGTPARDDGGTTRAGIDLFPSLAIVNRYGLFAVMTTSRPEIVIEGSDDGVDWKPYEFKFKAGDVHRPLRWVAPYQPRLDWQMWFAALTRQENVPWFSGLMQRLLEGSPHVLDLSRRIRFRGSLLVRFEPFFTITASRMHRRVVPRERLDARTRRGVFSSRHPEVIATLRVKPFLAISIVSGFNLIVDVLDGRRECLGRKLKCAERLIPLHLQFIISLLGFLLFLRVCSATLEVRNRGIKVVGDLS
jgi:hypothetical protein